MSIQIISQTEYDKIITDNKNHIENILDIVKKAGRF